MILDKYFTGQEGFERYSDTEFKRFLDIAKASCGEVRSMLYLAEDFNYIKKPKAQEMRNKCMALSGSIQNLINSIKALPTSKN